MSIKLFYDPIEFKNILIKPYFNNNISIHD